MLPLGKKSLAKSMTNILFFHEVFSDCLEMSVFLRSQFKHSFSGKRLIVLAAFSHYLPSALSIEPHSWLVLIVPVWTLSQGRLSISYKVLLPPAPRLILSTSVPSLYKDLDCCDSLVRMLQKNSCCDIESTDSFAQNSEADGRCNNTLD